MVFGAMKLPIVLFVGGAVIEIIEELQGILDIVPVDGEGNALGRIGAGRFGKVDDHGLVSGDDHGFAGEIVKSGLVMEVHDLFAADHAGDDEIAEGEREMVGWFIAFEDVKLAVFEVENAAVLRECPEAARFSEGYLVEWVAYRHGKRMWGTRYQIFGEGVENEVRLCYK